MAERMKRRIGENVRRKMEVSTKRAFWKEK
jgi:hypothetical protein